MQLAKYRGRQSAAIFLVFAQNEFAVGVVFASKPWVKGNAASAGF